ncbi:MAG: class I SAM-dependent methyltransferase [Planctomycetes bacterium]|nr:class I SAM-dependent methyltransferase [Planctomycetota bacterium]
MKTLHTRGVLALFLACVFACRAPQPANAPAPVPATDHPHDSAPEHANRDPHGPGDTERYIASLLAPDRIARFQVQLVLEKLAPAPDALVGDLGCGPGIFSLAFAERCPEGVVFASDIEPAQLDALTQRAARAGLTNVVPVLASLDDPHFPPGRLNFVFVADTYHHLENRVEYMQRLARALAPGGRVVLIDYKPGKLAHGPPPEHKLPAGQMESEMQQAGYVLVQSYDTHPEQDFQVWRPTAPWEKESR